MCLTAPPWKHRGISDWKNSHSSIYPRANSQTAEVEKQTITVGQKDHTTTLFKQNTSTERSILG